MESIFQSEEWANFKCATGYAESFRIDDILVLKKNLPLGRSMLYSPMVDESRKSKVESRKIMGEIEELANRTKAIFYRLELDVPTNNRTIEHSNNLRKLGFRKAFEEMQPEYTLILDLTKSEEEILAQMKQKGRYNIKIAQRNNLRLLSSNEKRTPPLLHPAGVGAPFTYGVISSQELLDNFYQLYEETGRRQKITFRGKAYFEKLLDKLGGEEYARVYCAYAQVESPNQRLVSLWLKKLKVESLDNSPMPLAAAIVVYSGNKAIYLFGASSSEHRNLMAPYFMQWEIIKEAKRKGFAEYDFFGIAPNDDENHPWAGVTRFKKQFGGREVQILGSYDLVFKPLEYKLFKFAEKIRR